MRLWSVHPKYLDAKGLVALWREGLLAQKVLQGGTRGYRNHPQLTRFKTLAHPDEGISFYLAAVVAEACARGYCFDASKIKPVSAPPKLTVTSGQLAFEWSHLLQKLAVRDGARLQAHQGIVTPQPHPLLHVIPGPVEDWERV